MTYRPKGKHVTIDRDSPQALGICDYTGFVHRRIDLVRQMEWRGNGLVWTGLYVGKDYVDKPNEQLRPPIFPPDPMPVLEPRPQQPSLVTWTNGQNAIWDKVTVYSWASWEGCEDGIPALPQRQRLIELQNFHWGA